MAREQQTFSSGTSMAAIGKRTSLTVSRRSVDSLIPELSASLNWNLVLAGKLPIDASDFHRDTKSLVGSTQCPVHRSLTAHETTASTNRTRHCFWTNLLCERNSASDLLSAVLHFFRPRQSFAMQHYRGRLKICNCFVCNAKRRLNSQRRNLRMVNLTHGSMALPLVITPAPKSILPICTEWVCVTM